MFITMAAATVGGGGGSKGGGGLEDGGEYLGLDLPSSGRWVVVVRSHSLHGSHLIENAEIEFEFELI